MISPVFGAKCRGSACQSSVDPKGNLEHRADLMPRQVMARSRAERLTQEATHHFEDTYGISGHEGPIYHL